MLASGCGGEIRQTTGPGGDVGQEVRQERDGGDAGQAPGDCAQQIEHRGVRYTERGFTHVVPLVFEQAVAVPCLDTGVELEPDTPSEYRNALRFRDHDPNEVLAVIAEDGLYRVMLSDSLDANRAASILRSVQAE